MCSKIWIALLPQQSSQIGFWFFLIEKVKGPCKFLSAKRKKACLPPMTDSFLIQNSDHVTLHVTFNKRAQGQGRDRFADINPWALVRSLFILSPGSETSPTLDIRTF